MGALNSIIIGPIAVKGVRARIAGCEYRVRSISPRGMRLGAKCLLPASDALVAMDVCLPLLGQTAVYRTLGRIAQSDGQGMEIRLSSKDRLWLRIVNVLWRRAQMAARPQPTPLTTSLSCQMETA